MTKITDAKSLALAFQARLAASGLTQADARKLRLYTVTSGQAEAKGVKPFAGMVIPYCADDGKTTLPFFRIRYLEPTLVGFEAQTNVKPRRYDQPKKTTVEIYRPPGRDWNAFLKTKERLIITEGEIKAAVACKYGYPCISLGGVWAFRSKKHCVFMLPWFLDHYEDFQDREVIIAYDNDAATNPQVVQAEGHLAHELIKLGARVFILRMPTLKNEAGEPIKTAIDDFILLKGPEAFGALLDKVTEFAESRELHALNDEVCYVRDPGLIMRLENFKRLDVGAFINHSSFATRTYHELQQSGSGTKKTIKMVEKSVPKEWVRFPYRFEVETITYAPEGPDMTEENCLNVWPGYGHDGSLQAKKGDVSLWEKFLDYMFKDAPENREWFCKWLCYPIQHPGSKMATATIIWSRMQGTGKTILGLAVGAVYGKNFIQITEKDLHGAFNSWADCKQFVLGDEVTSGDRRGTADGLKNMITQTTVTINQKYVPTYTIPDLTNFIFTTNHPDAFVMEEADRRFFIHRVPDVPESLAFYKSVERRFLNHPATGLPYDIDGQAALLYWMKNYPLGDFNQHTPAPRTTAKRDMFELTLSDVSAWVMDLKSNPELVLRLDDGKPLNWRLATSEQLFALYTRGLPNNNTTERRLIVAMANGGFQKAAYGNSIRCRDGVQRRIWILRDENLLADATPREIAELYEKDHPAIFEKRAAQRKF